MFREHVGLIWLHFVGLSAPALFHLKIISYGNSDVKLIWVGLWAVNKLELLLGVGVASLCRPPLPSPVFWVAHLGESVHFKLLERLGIGVSAGPQKQWGEGRVAPWGTLRRVMECWNVFMSGSCPRKQALFQERKHFYEVGSLWKGHSWTMGLPGVLGTE